MLYSLVNIASILLATMAVISSAESTCTLSDSDTCAVESLKPSDDGSALIYPGGNTRCAFDNYKDNVTTFSANETYFFQVFPNKALDKSKLLIYFQGGGGCTNEDTCSFSLQCSLADNLVLFTTAATVRGAGVIDRFKEDNMFKDWNVVFVPYCTADIFIGNRVVPARESGIEGQLGNPQCLGLDYPMHMNGYNNTMAVLNWALHNYPEVDQLVLGGSSAGSLGAQFYSTRVAKMWDVDAKHTKFSVMADSYVGFFPNNHPMGETMEYYGACSNDLDFPDRITAACKAKTATTTEIVEALLETRPGDDWLFINSKGDEVARFYYELLAQGIQGFPFPNLMSEESLYRNVSAMLDAYKSVNSHVSSFFVEGKHHVFLMDSNFTDYRSDKGVRLGDYINEWLTMNSSQKTGLIDGPIPLMTSPPTVEREARSIAVNQAALGDQTQHLQKGGNP